MATINISDLRPAGSDLFSDSESYMSELGDNELVKVNGGSTVICFRIGYAAVRSSQKCAAGIAGAANAAKRWWDHRK
ncbi:hypothetical protein [Nostoc sp.]|uniref:hypothetical protein n=1 Tax=Nostoc sp. TaxID=1180 RepID=UPI002FFA0DDA